MAQKRMFSMKIVDSDAFLNMPLSAQCLYFHLNMRADDDGFVDKPKTIMRLINASEDDLRILIAKNFVIWFESGVLVIKHWRVHNTLSAGRYHPTAYLTEKSELFLKENASYSLAEGASLDDKKLITMGMRQVDEQKTNNRRAKDEPRQDLDKGIDKNKTKSVANIEDNSITEKATVPLPPPTLNFTAPTLEEVETYKQSTNSPVPAKRFCDYYTARGWKIKGDDIRDWKALFDSWAKLERPVTEDGKPIKRAIIGEDIERHEYTDEQLASLITKLDEEE